MKYLYYHDMFLKKFSNFCSLQSINFLLYMKYSAILEQYWHYSCTGDGEIQCCGVNWNFISKLRFTFLYVHIYVQNWTLSPCSHN